MNNYESQLHMTVTVPFLTFHSLYANTMRADIREPKP